MPGPWSLASHFQIELEAKWMEPNWGISVTRIAPMTVRKIAPEITGRIASLGYCRSTAKLARAIDQPRDRRPDIDFSIEWGPLCVSRPDCGNLVASGWPRSTGGGREVN